MKLEVKYCNVIQDVHRIVSCCEHRDAMHPDIPHHQSRYRNIVPCCHSLATSSRLAWQRPSCKFRPTKISTPSIGSTDETNATKKCKQRSFPTHTDGCFNWALRCQWGRIRWQQRWQQCHHQHHQYQHQQQQRTTGYFTFHLFHFLFSTHHIPTTDEQFVRRKIQSCTT